MGTALLVWAEGPDFSREKPLHFMDKRDLGRERPLFFTNSDDFPILVRHYPIFLQGGPSGRGQPFVDIEIPVAL